MITQKKTPLIGGIASPIMVGGIVKPTRGPELVANGADVQDTSGWSAQNGMVMAVNGRLRLTGLVGMNGTAWTSPDTEIGKTYEWSCEVDGNANLRIQLGYTSADSSQYYSDTNTGQHSGTFVALGTKLRLNIRDIGDAGGAGDYVEIFNATVREVF